MSNWLEFIPAQYAVGQIWEGRIRAVAPFGVFVRLADGADTLVELSHMTDDWLRPTEWVTRTPADYVSVDDVIQIRVRSIYEGRSQMRSEFVEKKSRL